MKKLLTLVIAAPMALLLSMSLATAQDQSANPTNPPAPSIAPGPPPPSAPSPPALNAPGQPGASGLLVDASAVIGSSVRGTDGKDLGRVNRLMLDPQTGRVTTVVIGIGGTLGFNEKLVSMPWESVKIAQDQGRVIVSVDRGLLEQAPSASPRTAPEPGPPKR